MRSISSLLRRPRVGIQLAVATALFAAACTPAATPAPTTAPAKPAAAPTTAPAKPAAAPTAAPAAATTAPAPTTVPAGATTAPAPARPAATTAPATPKTVTLPPPEVKSITIGSASIEPNSISAFLANELGLFKRYGFENVELLDFDTDTKAIGALISGQLEFTTQGVTTPIASQLTDTPLLVVAMQGNKLSDMLVSRPDVKSAADLKGKSIAIASFGGVSHASALILIEALGLTDQDVTIQQVGGNAARFAAVQAGASDAGVVDVLQMDEAKQLGLNILTTSAAAPGQFARSGLVTRAEFAQKNPNTVLAFVAANLEAQQALYTQEDKAVDAYMKRAQLTDRAEAVAGIKGAQEVDTRSMRWNKDAFDLAQEVAAVANPDIASVDVTKVYTFEFLDKLRDMGFYDQVGAPKS